MEKRIWLRIIEEEKKERKNEIKTTAKENKG